MKKNDPRLQRIEIHLDPRYASARPWDWWVCQSCGALIPRRCPHCGSAKLSDKRSQIIRSGLAQFGPPPFLFKKVKHA